MQRMTTATSRVLNSVDEVTQLPISFLPKVNITIDQNGKDLTLNCGVYGRKNRAGVSSIRTVTKLGGHGIGVNPNPRRLLVESGLARKGKSLMNMILSGCSEKIDFSPRKG